MIIEQAFDGLVFHRWSCQASYRDHRSPNLPRYSGDILCRMIWGCTPMKADRTDCTRGCIPRGTHFENARLCNTAHGFQMCDVIGVVPGMCQVQPQPHGTFDELKNWRRPLTVANLRALPQKWPAPSWKVAGCGASRKQISRHLAPAAGECERSIHFQDPPWRQPRGKWMISGVNSDANASSKRWHLWAIDLRFAINSTPGWL